MLKLSYLWVVIGITVGIAKAYCCFGAVIQPYSHSISEIKQVEMPLFCRR